MIGRRAPTRATSRDPLDGAASADTARVSRTVGEGRPTPAAVCRTRVETTPARPSPLLVEVTRVWRDDSTRSRAAGFAPASWSSSPARSGTTRPGATCAAADPAADPPDAAATPAAPAGPDPTDTPSTARTRTTTGRTCPARRTVIGAPERPEGRPPRPDPRTACGRPSRAHRTGSQAPAPPARARAQQQPPSSEGPPVGPDARPGRSVSRRSRRRCRSPGVGGPRRHRSGTCDRGRGSGGRWGG